MFLENLTNKNLRVKFNALCEYTQTMCKAKRCWTVILNKMDAHIKRRAILRWMSNSHMKRE